MPMAKKYKLYLFDLDGTLLESDTLIRVTFYELYKKYKPENFVIDDAKIITFSGPQISETLANEFPEYDLNMMLSEWKLYSQKNYEKCVHLYDGADELLKKMYEKNTLFSIITNKHRYAVDYTFNFLK